MSLTPLIQEVLEIHRALYSIFQEQCLLRPGAELQGARGTAESILVSILKITKATFVNEIITILMALHTAAKSLLSPSCPFTIKVLAPPTGKITFKLRFNTERYFVLETRQL